MSSDEAEGSQLYWDVSVPPPQAQQEVAPSGYKAFCTVAKETWGWGRGCWVVCVGKGGGGGALWGFRHQYLSHGCAAMEALLRSP